MLYEKKDEVRLTRHHVSISFRNQIRQDWQCKKRRNRAAGSGGVHRQSRSLISEKGNRPGQASVSVYEAFLQPAKSLFDDIGAADKETGSKM